MTITSQTNPTANYLADKFPSLMKFDRQLLNNISGVSELTRIVRKKYNRPDQIQYAVSKNMSVAFNATLSNIETSTKITADIITAMMQIRDIGYFSLSNSINMSDLYEVVQRNPGVDMIIPEQFDPSVNVVFFEGLNSGRLIAFTLNTSNEHPNINVSVFERSSEPTDFEALQYELIQEKDDTLPTSIACMFKVKI